MSISTVRNVVQKWKARRTVIVKKRCGRPKKNTGKTQTRDG